MELKNSQTYKNLAASFAGECQAHVRYKFIEYLAREEGLRCVADMIHIIVHNEFHHARMFYSKLQKGNTEIIRNINISTGYPFKEKSNLIEALKLASENEEEEETKIYPTYSRIAEEEGFDDVAELYDDIVQVESCHKKMLLDLYDQLKNKTIYKKPNTEKWKCADCGYEAVDKSPWKDCPICNSNQGNVMLKLKDEN